MSSENYNNPFPKRLRDLMEEGGKTQAMLAKRIDVSRQTVSKYMDGNAQPNSTTIVKIAEYLDVTTDYLLGKERVRKYNPCLVNAEQYTHLEESALQALHDYVGDNIDIGILSHLIENGTIFDLVKCIRDIMILRYQCDVINYKTELINIEEIEELNFKTIATELFKSASSAISNDLKYELEIKAYEKNEDFVKFAKEQIKTLNEISEQINAYQVDGMNYFQNLAKEPKGK